MNSNLFVVAPVSKFIKLVSATQHKALFSVTVLKSSDGKAI